MTQNTATEAIRTVSHRLSYSPQIVDKIVALFNLLPWQSKVVRNVVSDRNLRDLHPFGCCAINTIAEMNNNCTFLNSTGESYSFQNIMCTIADGWDNIAIPEKLYVATLLGGQRKAPVLYMIFEELAWMSEVDDVTEYSTEFLKLEEFLSGFRIITEG